MRLRFTGGALLSLLFLALWNRAIAGGNELGESPRLVVFIVVDQLRADYLDRFSSLFRFGLRTLLERGIFFEDAHQDHAITSTGPGHAALISGYVPARSGVINNAWYDRLSRREVNCVEDRSVHILGSSATGRSPRNLLVSTLADWIRSVSPNSKAFAVSRKDRGAILLGGHRAEAAFWYDSENGRFVTSSYYMTDYPAWLEDFLKRRFPDQIFGTLWEPLPVSEEDLRKMGIFPLPTMKGFPHAIGATALLPDPSFYSAFGSTPFMDEYLTEFVAALIQAEGLGRDAALDFLGVSFSALDSVGHTFGPNSREALDTLMRLDKTLGHFFELLEAEVGMSRVLVTLSSDHGVMPLPELLPELGFEGSRLEASDVACYQKTLSALVAQLGEGNWLLEDFYLNYETIGRKNLLRGDVERRLGNLLSQCDAVERVWTRTELEGEPGPDGANSFFRVYRDSFHPDRSPDLHVQWKPFRLDVSGFGTSHGSPYEYDSHVPMLLMVPGRGPARIAGRVRTVDLAPTLASLLGIPVPPDLDGVDRSAHLGASFAAQ